jgi:hypothetical protein
MFEFLPLHLRVLVYIGIALVGARVFLAVMRFPEQDANRWLLAWAVLTPVAFFSGHFLLFALATVVACVVLRRKMPGRAAAIYIALLPMIPLFSYSIPGFAGINKLITLDYHRVLVLGLLIPAWIAARRSDASRERTRGVVDFFVLYASWVILHAFLRPSSVTDNLRTALEAVLFLLLPYVALRRLIVTRDDIRAAVTTLVFSAFVVAFISFVEQRMTQNLYAPLPALLELPDQTYLTVVQYLRFGLLRIRGSIGGGIGFFMVFALSGLICLWRLGLLRGWRFPLGVVTLLLPIFFTGTRGAWIMCALTLATIVGFRFIATPARFLTASALSLFVLPRVLGWLATAEDDFGTFQYRVRLLESSLPLIWEKPIAGWGTLLDVFASGRLEHMRQGEGIIDIVNTYLLEAMVRGVPGVVLFTCALLASVVAVLRRLRDCDESELAFCQPVAAFLTSVALGLSFLLVTTSPTGHTMAYLSLLVVLSTVFAALPRTGIVGREVAIVSNQPKRLAVGM